jgi:hypothetical protein
MQTRRVPEWLRADGSSAGHQAVPSHSSSAFPGRGSRWWSSRSRRQRLPESSVAGVSPVLVLAAAR